MPPRRRSAKKGRVSETAAVEADALISLPAEILDDILTRLGIRDAVRTSALSRAWRHRWEALASLDLEFLSPGDDGAPPEELGALDSILLRCPGRVRLFYAALDDAYAGRIHDWLRVLSRRGVEILSLCFNGTFPFPVLPSSVFSCGRLTSLTLCACVIPLLPPGFVSFPELRKLALENIRFQANGEYQFEEIIDRLPLLEDLSLIGGAYVRRWVIRAPNLRRLTIISEKNDVWILKKLTSLCSAEIVFSDFLLRRNFAKFLSELVQVTELAFATCDIPVNFITSFPSLAESIKS
jgi:hypothetical protein